MLGNAMPYIGYNVNLALDPIHHTLVMENGDDFGGYHLEIVNLDSCNGTSCSITSLDNQTSCKAAMGYWADGVGLETQCDVHLPIVEQLQPERMHSSIQYGLPAQHRSH